MSTRLVRTPRPDSRARRDGALYAGVVLMITPLLAVSGQT